MKFGFADPPYLGCGSLYAKHHPDALVWDDPETHRALIGRLCDEYSDGWVLCLSSPSHDVIKPMCPAGARTGIWVKPFCAFKVNVNPAYAYEPVIWFGGRKRGRDQATVRDWCAESITLERGLTGAKPRKFCFWAFDLLGADPGDTLDDLFSGTNAVAAAWAEYMGERSPLPSLPLEELSR